MKERQDKIADRVTVASGKSILLQVQSQRLLASLTQLAVDINSASQTKILHRKETT